MNAARINQANQGAFDFLMPPGKEPLIKPIAAARSLCRKLDFIYAMIQEGKLEAHAPSDRTKQRYTITRRSLCLLHAETALYSADDFGARVESLLPLMSASQLTSLIIAATQRRARL